MIFIVDREPEIEFRVDHIMAHGPLDRALPYICAAISRSYGPWGGGALETVAGNPRERSLADNGMAEAIVFLPWRGMLTASLVATDDGYKMIVRSTGAKAAHCVQERDNGAVVELLDQRWDPTRGGKFVNATIWKRSAPAEEVAAAVYASGEMIEKIYGAMSAKGELK